MRQLLLVLLLSGCGMDVHVKYDTPPPITVNHNVNLNFDNIQVYCNKQCALDHSNPDDVITCANTCFSNFMQLFLAGTGK